MRNKQEEENIFGCRPIAVLLVLLLIGALFVFWNFIGIEKTFVLTGDAQIANIPEIFNLAQAIKTDGIPMWSFSKGLGQQITVGNPGWLGDIFALLPALLTGDLAIYLMGIAAVAKIVLSGVFFYSFLKELGVAPITRVLFSFLYAFNGHMICRGLWMHYATEVVFVALWLWSLERYYHGKRLMFPISVALLLLSRSAAYFYIYSGLSFFYLMIREWFQNGFHIKNIVNKIFRFVPFYLLGVGLSAILLIPGIFALLFNSNRISNHSFLFENPLEINNLHALITTFLKAFSNPIWGYHWTGGSGTNILEDPGIYSGIITAFIFPQLFFSRSERKTEKRAMIAMVTLALSYYIFPYIRYVFNAFSSDAYKISSFWTIICFILASVYISHRIETGKEPFRKGVFAATCAVYFSIFAIAFYFYHSKLNLRIFAIMVLFVGAFAVIILSKFKVPTKRLFILSLCFFEVISISQEHYLKFQDPFPYIRIEDTYAPTLKALKSDTFYRINTDLSTNYINASQYYGYYSTESYTSVQPKRTLNFYELFGLKVNMLQMFPNFKMRHMLNDLLGVRYYVCALNSTQIPKRYDYLCTANGVDIYENRDVLALGFLFDSYVLEEEIALLTNEEKDFAALNNAILKEPLSGNVQLIHSLLPVKQPESQIQVQFSSVRGLEAATTDFPQTYTYVSLGNDPNICLNIPEESVCNRLQITATIVSEVDTLGEIYYANKEEAFSENKVERFDLKAGTHTYVIEFSDTLPIRHIRFDVGTCEGYFEIRDFSLYALPEFDIEGSVYERRSHEMQVEKFTSNHIIGRVQAEKDSILFLSIPYDDGWTIKVNGEERPALVVDAMFMGCALEPGEYEIELRYRTPGLLPGAIISGSALVILAVLAYRLKRKEKQL
ncbi:hypothetical protein N510_000652 [Firmicutes bacterium ASF500]|nr:hypothetical protein N510_000652 [Firmicutes bacterium ASF500]